MATPTQFTSEEGYGEALRRIAACRDSGSMTLDLRRLSLAKLPASVSELTQVRMIILSHNLLTTLPPEIAELSNLEALVLRHNRFASLPPAVARLTQLKALLLDNNGLTTLPEDIEELSRLEKLSLSHNPLGLPPEALWRMRSLTSLGLSGILDGRSIPLHLCDLTNLKELSLNHNRLLTLPPEIEQLRQLDALFLINNQLASLPSGISELGELRQLFLSRNYFRDLPIELSRMTKLEVLDVSSNAIDALPRTIGSHPALRELNLSNNRLTELPTSLSAVEELEINVDGNPLPPVIRAFAKEGWQYLRRYLGELEVGAAPVWEAKLVLVGEGRVGKTCLLRALLGKEFAEQSSTPGVDVTLDAFACDHPNKPGVKITLNAWDFAGQDIYRITHQFFFTSPAIYLVPWHVRLGPDSCSVEFWLNVIRSRVGPDARVFVVATHVRSERTLEDIPKGHLRRKFGPMIVDFIDVDSKTGYHVRELKDAIILAASQLPQVDTVVPSALLSAMQHVFRESVEPWMLFDDFQLVSRLSEAEARLLAFSLKVWGRVVYFGDAGESPSSGDLANYIILKPEWLTKAIALVLEDGETKERSGELKHDRLPAIWESHAREDRPTYSRKHHPYLLALMEKFDVSYRIGIPLTSLNSLIPQLIRTERPHVDRDMPWLPESHSGRVPQAAMTFVLTEDPPPGVIPLLIVRTHHLSARNHHWKTGAFLRHPTHGDAHIELVDRELRIVVRSPYPPHLIGLLTDTGSMLFKEVWPGLAYELSVPCPTILEDVSAFSPSVAERTDRPQPVKAMSRPCKGRFVLDSVWDFRATSPSARTMYCQSCRRNIGIDLLLSGQPIEHAERWQAEFSSKLDGMKESLEHLCESVPRTAAESANQFRRLYEYLGSSRRSAPSTYSLIIEKKSGWFRSRFELQVRLTLWCENPGHCHPLAAIGSGRRGEYLIEVPAEWLIRWAPVIKWTLLALKAAVPVGNAILRTGLDAALFKDIESKLTLGEKAVAALPGGDLTADAEDLPISGKAHSPDEPELREFHRLLSDKVKDRTWGGLVNTQLPDKTWRWLCPACRSKLNPQPLLSLAEGGKPVRNARSRSKRGGA